MIYTNCNTNQFFDPFFDAVFGKENKAARHFAMKTDIYESENAYRLDVEVPGVTKEDIILNFKDGYLTIEVTAKERTEEGYTAIRQERLMGEASRQFYLGEVDEKAISAKYENGILTVMVPKTKPEEAKPHSIVIE